MSGVTNLMNYQYDVSVGFLYACSNQIISETSTKVSSTVMIRSTLSPVAHLIEKCELIVDKIKEDKNKRQNRKVYWKITHQLGVI